MRNACVTILVSASVIFGQSIDISGKVTNAAGSPLQGAVVQIFSTPMACTTQADGSYHLSGTTRTIGAEMYPPVSNSITYRNRSFVFTVSKPAQATAALTRSRGSQSRRDFQRRLNQGINTIPFSLHGIGSTMLVLRARIGHVSHASV